MKERQKYYKTNIKKQNKIKTKANYKNGRRKKKRKEKMNV